MTTLSLNVPRIRSAIRDLRVTIRNRPGEGWTPPDWLRWLPPEDRSWIVGPVPTHHHLIWACMAWVRSLVGNDWADTSAIDGADLDVRSKDALYRLHGCVTGGFDPSQISTHPPTENWTLKELDDILRNLSNRPRRSRTTGPKDNHGKSDRVREGILTALLAEGAVSEATRTSPAKLVKHLRTGLKPASLKKHVVTLQRMGRVETKPHGGGGTWLTATGCVAARQLMAAAARGHS